MRTAGFIRTRSPRWDGTTAATVTPGDDRWQHDFMLGRLHHVVLDCPDPRALAGFYSRLLGDPVTYVSADWVVVSASSQASGLAFQRAPGHRPPAWPDP